MKKGIVCGLDGLKIGDPCPKCGKPLQPSCDVPGCTGRVETYSRIVGYFRPVSNWNDGKAQEFRERREFVEMKGDHVD